MQSFLGGFTELIVFIMITCHIRPSPVADWRIWLNCRSFRRRGLIPGLGSILEKGMATHSSILARKIPRIEGPGYLQSIGWHNQTQLKWLSRYTQGCYLFIYFCCCCSCCYSVAQLCPTFYESTDCSTPGFPVLHHLLETAQTHVHWVSDAIQPSCPLSSTSALNLSPHQGLF